MNDVVVRCVDLPTSIKGLVKRDREGDYNVYVNARLPIEVQRGILHHELEHIENGDIESDWGIRRVEGIA